MRSLDPETLRRLNSITKYPSIPTYHALGERGVLRDVVAVDFASSALYVTEKIDGTNARLTLLPMTFDRGFLIGSREEWLTCEGDRVANPSLGIVETVMPLAEVFSPAVDLITVYGEVYGGKINGGKQYSGEGRTMFRAFDVSIVPADVLRGLLEYPLDKIARWREGGGQPFLNVADLHEFCARGISTVPSIPFSGGMPVGLDSTAAWLGSMAYESRCALDNDAGNKAEGVVVRSFGRSLIAKLRHEDYTRTLKGRKP